MVQHVKKALSKFYENKNLPTLWASQCAAILTNVGGDQRLTRYMKTNIKEVSILGNFLPNFMFDFSLCCIILLVTA